MLWEGVRWLKEVDGPHRGCARVKACVWRGGSMFVRAWVCEAEK